MRKFNRRLFWGVLTTNLKPRADNIILSFRAKKERSPKARQFMTQQMRSFDARRMRRPLGKLSETDFEAVLDKLCAR